MDRGNIQCGIPIEIMADQFAEFFGGRPDQFWGLPQNYSRIQDFFPEAQDDAAYRAQLTGVAPKKGFDLDNPGQKELALAAMTGDPMGTLDLAKKIRADKESHALLKELAPIDPASKDYPSEITKLLGKYTYGAMDPRVEHVLNLKQLSVKHAKDTRYDEQAAKALKGFLSIPEDDPKYDEKYQAWLNAQPDDLLSHPRLASLLERGQHNSAAIRARRSLEQQELSNLQKEARKLNVDTGKYKTADELRDAIFEASQVHTQRKEFHDALKDIDPKTRAEYLDHITGIHQFPTDEEKMEAVGVTSESKMTPQLWDLGYRKAIAKKQANFNKAMTGLSFIAGRDLFSLVNPSGPKESLPQGMPGSSAAPTPELPGAPSDGKATQVETTLYNAPIAERPEVAEERKQLEAQKAMIEAPMNMADAIEEALTSDYKRKGIPIAEAAQVIDDLIDLNRQVATGEVTIEEANKEKGRFLETFGVPANVNTLTGLNAILEKRKARHGIPAGVISGGTVITAGKPKKT